MGIREDVLALADEMEGVSLKDDCESCLASGTGLCRGDLECAESAHKACAKRLRAIAEHDADDVTTVSAYDLLSEEDREALAWVREQGGLAAVEKRLMPEGMEWPTVDGKPVVIGERMRSCGIDDCKVVGIDPANSRLTLASDNIEEGKATYFTDFAEDCHRPMPKVLDADGVEIRVGDRLYDTDTGCGRTVRAVNDNGTVEFDGHENRGWFGLFLTHRAPVLAADGEPLREGEHVYHVETGAELVVKELPKPGEYQAVVVFALPTSPASHLTSFDPDRLTHERPDSWERLEEDMDLNPFDYCKKVGHKLWTFDNAEEFKASDLVRRAKKLAGVDND